MEKNSILEFPPTKSGSVILPLSSKLLFFLQASSDMLDSKWNWGKNYIFSPPAYPQKDEFFIADI